jgi:XTP/dITP diphosphohydrolase
MRDIVIATENRGKAEEIKEIFKGSGFNPRFLYEFRSQFPGLEIQENAKTFEGNALIKAIIVGDLLQLPALADDSGLCIDALGGRPGVYSARYSGTGTDEGNCLKVLSEMEGQSGASRSCHYECVVAFYDPASKFVETVSGIWEGRLAETPRGSKSFGYAPIFLAKDFDYLKSNAEFDPHELIAINHRGQAFRKAAAVLSDFFK